MLRNAGDAREFATRCAITWRILIEGRFEASTGGIVNGSDQVRGASQRRWSVVSIKPTIACDCPVLPLPVLIREHIQVDSVTLGEIDHFEAGVLTVNATASVEGGSQVIAVSVDVIAPGERNVACDTILDFFPIAVKADGVVGLGVTRIADGVV